MSPIFIDLDQILKQSFDAYINSLDLNGGTLIQQSAYKVDAYARLLEDMGFSTAYFPQQSKSIKNTQSNSFDFKVSIDFDILCH